jgi:hypothetical protein
MRMRIRLHDISFKKDSASLFMTKRKMVKAINREKLSKGYAEK